MIAALFVDPEGPYVGLQDVDPWDEKRDARTYRGPHPVIAHPPCERWGRFAEGAPLHKTEKIGDDGGCFAAALQAVRTYGGVIEHPQGSHAWRTFGLPIPKAETRRSRGWTVADAWGGRSCHVDQGTYGHKAQKPTWLYAVLPVYPDLNWKRTWGLAYIGGDGFHDTMERAKAKASGRYVRKEQVPKEERHLTPPLFRDALLNLALYANNWTPARRQVQLAPFAPEEKRNPTAADLLKRVKENGPIDLFPGEDSVEAVRRLRGHPSADPGGAP